MNSRSFGDRFMELIFSIVLFIPGVPVLMYSELEWLSIIAFCWLIMMFSWGFFVILGMIPWLKILKLGAVLIILILVVFCLLPSETAENLPEWAKFLVGIAVYAVFIVVYMTVSLLGAAINYIGKNFRNILNDHSQSNPECKWREQRNH